MGSVNKALGEAFTLEWACFFSFTVAFPGLAFFFIVEGFSVVGINHARHVRHAAVTDLDVVPVKHFVKRKVCGDVFVEKAEKFIGYVCLDVLAIEPDGNPFPFLSAGARVAFFVVGWNLQPYKKHNDNPIYIHTKSNHPPNIIKQLPKNKSQRISDISSSKEIFDKAAPYYNNALKASGYKETIEFSSVSRLKATSIKEIDFFRVGLDCYFYALIFKNFGDFFPGAVWYLAAVAVAECC